MNTLALLSNCYTRHVAGNISLTQVLLANIQILATTNTNWSYTIVYVYAMSILVVVLLLLYVYGNKFQ